MPKEWTGYKGSRKGVAQRVREARERAYRKSDPPPMWESTMADSALLRDLLDGATRSELPDQNQC